MNYRNFILKRSSSAAWQAVLVISSLFLAVIPLHSQSKRSSTPEQDDVVRVSSNLVNVDVMVKDKKGRPITDLKAEDFILTENGVPQKIEFFDATLASDSVTTKPADIPLTNADRRANNLPRNIISLVLDGQTTEGANLKYVRDGMIKYIRDRISDQDSVALFAISGGLQLLQPFTQDKEKLIAAVEKANGVSTGSKTTEQSTLNDAMAAIRDQLSRGPSDPVTSAAGGSAAAQAMISRRVLEQYVQLRSTLSSQQTRPVLAGLAAICEALRAIPGKKTLVVFSQGFVAPQNLDWQVQSTIDIANRANVAIYIIDSSGLTGGTPQSGALVPSSALSGISAATSQENRIRAGAGESVFDITRQEGLNRQQDLLYRISGDTGGQFIKNTNDIAGGLERIHEEIRSRYTLTYRSTDQNFDGSFRKVKIEVNRPDTKVSARPGYFAIPPEQIVPLSPEDKKLVASFDTIASHPTLPLSWQLNSFRSQPGYVVALSFEVPPSALDFGQAGAKQKLQLDVLGLVRAEGSDKILSRLGANFDVSLSPQQYESIVHDKVFYRQDMQLEPGSYIVDLLVKDRTSGKVAAARQNLALPITDSEFAASELVLSHHAEPLHGPPTEGGDVLSAGSVQIRPSPSREFQNSDKLIMFFKLYNAAAMAETGKPLVRIDVRLIKDGKVVLKPLEYELTEVDANPVAHLTFAKYVDLAGLAAGKYSVVIEARDMVQKKTLTQEQSFVIKP